jgi:hypothetical protein
MRGAAVKHRWGEKLVVSPYKTEQQCTSCGIVKAKRYEPDNFPPHWEEFWRGLDRIECMGTPACEPVSADA